MTRSRGPSSHAYIYLLDARIEKLSGFIPEGFHSAWSARSFLEGARKEVPLSKAERDPAVRKAALKHYGAICMACGFKGHESQLEVHHLAPIAEGQRRTKLEDVAVLCANSHRLAHSTVPPMTLANLRAAEAKLRAARENSSQET